MPIKCCQKAVIFLKSFSVTGFLRFTITAVILLLGTSFCSQGQTLPGFTATAVANEQELKIINLGEQVTIDINAPLHFNPSGKTYLVFFALPNGNSIEWTKGKKMNEGDDWHFNIQHIAAQTRYIRKLDKKNNYIVVYVMAEQKSWPTWKRSTTGALPIIKNLIDSITSRFSTYNPKLVLNGHSGGGSFVFGYLDAVESIPKNVERIAFLDSDYGYETAMHTSKIVNWLQQDNQRKLLVLAYNDSVVIYNGKPLVSATGGTWYRSRLMQRELSEIFRFKTETDTAFIRHTALKGRIQFILKKNPNNLIYHTEQVARNGFILSLLSGTKYDRKKYFTYFGKWVYDSFIIE